MSTPIPRPLDGKTIILTGGAGIYGKALSEALARAGANLVLASRDTVALEKVAAELGREGSQVAVEAFDQGEESAAPDLCQRVKNRFGRIDGLVNNAAARPMKSFHDDVSAWKDSMQVNATGVFLMCREFCTAMAGQGGSVVNIGSIYGVTGPTIDFYKGTDMISPPDYYFHKAGMLNLTRYFAAYFGPAKVRVNYIAAGGALQDQPEEFRGRYEAATFLQRMAEPAELGGPVVFLLSEAASYVTGACLAVDGGFTAH